MAAMEWLVVLAIACVGVGILVVSLRVLSQRRAQTEALVATVADDALVEEEETPAGGMPNLSEPEEEVELTYISMSAPPTLGHEVSLVASELRNGSQQRRVLRTLVSVAAETRCGRERSRNDDAFLVERKKGIFAVADGVGPASSSSDEASRTALSTLSEALLDDSPALAEVMIRGAPSARLPRDARQLMAAVFKANDVLYKRIEMQPEQSRVATTLTALRFSELGQFAYIAHVGDSRCYRLRNGEIEALTTDHAENGELTRSLGLGPRLHIDFRIEQVEIGDVFLLCTDGVVLDLVSEVLATASDHEPKRAVRELAHSPEFLGARDDATVVVVKPEAIVRSSVKLSRLSLMHS
jgi:protein phosphatase